VEKGRPLYQACSKFPKAFSNLAVNFIRIGENSGSLSESLLQIAEEQRQRQLLKRKIITALIYPALIVSCTLIIIFALSLYVFPKVIPIFRSVNFEPPWTTQLLLSFSSLVINNLLVAVIALGLFMIAILVFTVSSRFKRIRHQLLIILPIIGSVAKNYALINMCRTMGKLLNHHVPLLKTIIITTNTSSNYIYQQQLTALSQYVNQGKSFATSLKSFPKLFPPFLIQLAEVGEKTGALGDNLVFIAELLEEEMNDASKYLSVLLEPILMISVGGIVGFIAISIISPIYQVTQTLHG
jgi:type II secretory pathway component PulF